MITSKSPRRVLLTAYHIGKDALPQYSSKFSRRDFELTQLFACLVLKEFEKKDYRGVEQLLLDCPHWGAEIGMPVAPDHTTLKRAADRLMKLPCARRLLDGLLGFARACKVLGTHVALAAMDASGFEARHVSAYFVRRCKGKARDLPKKPGVSATYRMFPKLALVVDTDTHLALSFVAGLTGPSSDHPHFERALFDAWRRVPGRIGKLAADAGYDAERLHEVARQDMGVATLIPALIGRPTKKPPSTRWRRHMARLLRTKRGRRKSGYTQRWQAETVNSMMKRNQGSALRARTHRTRTRELALRVLTHNLAVLRTEGRNRANSLRLTAIQSARTFMKRVTTGELPQRLRKVVIRPVNGGPREKPSRGSAHFGQCWQGVTGGRGASSSRVRARIERRQETLDRLFRAVGARYSLFSVPAPRQLTTPLGSGGRS